MPIIIKWRINVFLKLKRLQQPLSPSNFDGLHYPRGKMVTLFFHENDHKGFKRDYLYALGNFFSVLEQPGKTRKGVATTPL